MANQRCDRRTADTQQPNCMTEYRRCRLGKTERSLLISAWGKSKIRLPFSCAGERGVAFSAKLEPPKCLLHVSFLLMLRQIASASLVPFFRLLLGRGLFSPVSGLPLLFLLVSLPCILLLAAFSPPPNLTTDLISKPRRQHRLSHNVRFRLSRP